MSKSDSHRPSRPPDEPRAPRRAKPRPSLKMQAIGFLSRREHSRQELRAKLLDALRKHAREDAASSAAAAKAALALAEASGQESSNGIDDAFVPPAPSALNAALARPARPARLTPPAPPPPTGRPATSASPAAVGGLLPDAAWPDATSPDVASPDDALPPADPEAAVDELLDWLTANKYLDETRFVESRLNARSRKQGTLRIKLELSRHGLALDPQQAAALRDTEFARAQALWQRKFGQMADDARERGRQARFLAARGFAADVVRRIVGGLDEY